MSTIRPHMPKMGTVIVRVVVALSAIVNGLS